MAKKIQFPFEVPEYLKKEHAGIDELTRNLIESGEKEWHKLRSRGVTEAYLEYLDITDPKLMEKPMTEAYAKRKYAKAFKKIREAKKRNSKARVNGGKVKQKQALTIEKLVALLNTPDILNNKDLVDFINLYQNKKSSINKIAKMIEKYTCIGLSERTIRRILTNNKAVILINLAKATPKNPNSLNTENPRF